MGDVGLSVWTRKTVLTALSVAVLATLAVGGYALHTRRIEALQASPSPAQYPWALRTARVQIRDLALGFPVLATLSSQTEVVITPQLSATIREMGPREGQQVEKQQLLVRLDTQELEDHLAALKAQRQSAKDEVALQEKEDKRKEALLGKGYATQETVDRVQAALKTAKQSVNQLQNEIEALKTRLEYGVIRSPVSGVIAARLQEPGNLAAPGQPIYRITASAGAKIKITVPQTVAEQLTSGSEIVLSHGEQTRTIKVTRIFPALDALSMGSAEADLNQIPFGLPSGARVSGRVILDRWIDAKVLPRTALILSPDGRRGTIFRVIAGKDGAPGQVEKVEVQILASGSEGVAVKGDLSEGDIVVIAQENELLKLKDGDRVLPESKQRR